MKEQPQVLAAMEADDLAEHLVGLAQAAAILVREGELGTLLARLDEVRVAADAASGDRLRLLQVAEAFLRALAGNNCGRRAAALYRFLERSPEAGAIVGRLIDWPLCTLRWSDLAEYGPSVGEGVEDLLREGALRRVPEGLALWPSARTVARRCVSLRGTAGVVVAKI